MILVMSEKERSIIKEYKLEHVPIENDPTFSQEDIDKATAETRQRADAAKDIYLQAVRANILEMTRESFKSDRTITTLGDYLAQPFSRSFDERHEAAEYANKLKTKILPKIRALIDSSSREKTNDIVEF
jgi:hypothetical protein